jgi:mRNA interferase MazF
MVIEQGDVFWVDLGEPVGSAVVQNNAFNRSRINTVVVCALTSNLKRASSPGNVLLEPGEANLPRQSVVNISQVFTVDKSQLGEKIGSLSQERLRQVLSGLYLLLEPYEFE